MKKTKSITWLLILMVLSTVCFIGCDLLTGIFEKSTIIDFEDVVLPEAGYIDASTAHPAHEIESVLFLASYNETYGTSAGTTISSLTDTTTPGYTNAYSTYPGSGQGESSQFAILNPFGLTEPIIDFQDPVKIKSVYAANTTYAALSMRDGDQFAKQFTTEDEDYFIVTFEGLDENGESTGTVDFYLADFRAGTNTGILNSWAKVDLSSLGTIVQLDIQFTSSDVGAYGINTPMYVAIDNLEFVPIIP